MSIEAHLKQYGCFCYVAMKTNGYTRAAFDNEFSNLKKTHVVRASKYVCANGSGVKIQHIVPPTDKQLKAYKALIDKKVVHKTHDELADTTIVDFNWLHQRVISKDYSMNGWKVMCGNTQLGGVYTDQQKAVKDAAEFNDKAAQLKAGDGVHRDIAHVVSILIKESNR